MGEEDGWWAVSFGGGCGLGGRGTEVLEILETSVVGFELVFDVEFENEKRGSFGGEEDRVEVARLNSSSKDKVSPAPNPVAAPPEVALALRLGSLNVNDVAERLAACWKTPAATLDRGVT